MRVVLDLRPLQEPDRAPTTAAYLRRLLGAFGAEPLPGESFSVVLTAALADPTSHIEGLAVVGRRRMPPTRLLRSGALTVDAILLRGAAVGTGWRAAEHGAAGVVYHGVGSLPVLSGLPIVVSLLDLAPFEMPGLFQRTAVARLGQQLRARLVQRADAVIVTAEAVGRSAAALLHLAEQRIHVVPLAAGTWFDPPASVRAKSLAAERHRLGLPDRFLVFFGRYDARLDLLTVLRALELLTDAGRPSTLSNKGAWPPRLLLIGADPDDRAAIARTAARWGVGDLLAYTPGVDRERLATLVAGARAAVIPARSDGTAAAAIDALAVGTPVVASAVGALPEVVGGAGILVEPRDPDRLATALAAAWADDVVYGRIAEVARARASRSRRTWADVARETREIYASVGVRRPGRAS